MLFHLSLGTVRLCSAALAVAAFASSLFGVANAQDESPQCSEELFNVSQEMQQQYGLNVSQPSTRVVDDRVNPFPGSYIRYFAMITQYNNQSPYTKKTTFNAENFMRSTGIQLRLAKRAMEACPSTSKVAFGFSGSGYWIVYFRMPSGQVRQGVPLDCGRGNGNALQWGYFYSC